MLSLSAVPYCITFVHTIVHQSGWQLWLTILVNSNFSQQFMSQVCLIVCFSFELGSQYSQFFSLSYTGYISVSLPDISSIYPTTSVSLTIIITLSIVSIAWDHYEDIPFSKFLQ